MTNEMIIKHSKSNIENSIKSNRSTPFSVIQQQILKREEKMMSGVKFIEQNNQNSVMSSARNSSQQNNIDHKKFNFETNPLEFKRMYSIDEENVQKDKQNQSPDNLFFNNKNLIDGNESPLYNDKNLNPNLDSNKIIKKNLIMNMKKVMFFIKIENFEF